MYKGYKVEEVVLHSYALADDTAVIIRADAGCMACDEEGRVLPGHSKCGVTPQELRNDPSVSPRLEDGWGWILEYVGEDSAVDSWL